MLVLTRKENEEVYIEHNGETLSVVFLGFDVSGRAKIGFAGSKRFKIVREEAINKNHKPNDMIP